MENSLTNKTVIFDLDGTLLYTLEDLKDSMNFALSKFNYPQKNLEEIRNFVGNGVKVLMELSIPQGKNNENFNECLAIFKTHYAQNMYNKTKPYDGIIEMLENLQQQGFRTAVVSNKFDLATKELCKKYFAKKIEIAIGESENIRKKPAPDSIFKVMEILNSNKNSTYFVGDSEVDIQTAQNANIKCISVTWGYKDKEFLLKNGAKFLANSPKEILEIISQF
ncbi:HAD family hydrolase [bacterium]|nr:HAD family hydrolase [bacterium]